LFKENDLSIVEVSDKSEFNPLSPNSAEALVACTQLFSTIVCSLRKDVKIPVESTELFLDEMVGKALKASNQAQVTSLSRIVASVINKWKDGK
jgi:DNA repair/transcription protein MET18/MMS19